MFVELRINCQTQAHKITSLKGYGSKIHYNPNIIQLLYQSYLIQSIFIENGVKFLSLSTLHSKLFTFLIILRVKCILVKSYQLIPMYKCYELSELSKQEGFIGGDVNHNFDSESVLSES